MVAANMQFEGHEYFTVTWRPSHVLTARDPQSTGPWPLVLCFCSMAGVWFCLRCTHIDLFWGGFKDNLKCKPRLFVARATLSNCFSISKGRSCEQPKNTTGDPTKQK